MEAIHPFWVGTVLFIGYACLTWAARSAMPASLWMARSYFQRYGLIIVACCLTLGYAQLYALPAMDLGFPFVRWIGFVLWLLGGVCIGIGAGSMLLKWRRTSRR